jgi:competence protein ComEA
MRPWLLLVCIALMLSSAGPGVVWSAEEHTTAEGPAKKIDLNRATAEQLEEIPGIGPALARRIVEFRDKEGPFRRIEDLMKVRGIGEKSFQKMRPYVKVEQSG